jgi:hypothetical protein
MAKIKQVTTQTTASTAATTTKKDGFKRAGKGSDNGKAKTSANSKSLASSKTDKTKTQTGGTGADDAEVQTSAETSGSSASRPQPKRKLRKKTPSYTDAQKKAELRRRVCQEFSKAALSSQPHRSWRVQSLAGVQMARMVVGRRRAYSEPWDFGYPFPTPAFRRDFPGQTEFPSLEP